MDQLLPVVYMIGVLLLVIPTFLQSNSKLKQLLNNLTIWIIIVLVVLAYIYIFKINNLKLIFSTQKLSFNQKWKKIIKVLP